MENPAIAQEFNRLKNLKQNKDVAEDILMRSAKINICVKVFKSREMFSDPAEQMLGEERFRSYLENHELESESELDTLSSLIYNEVFESRLQKELNSQAEQKKQPPERLTKQLTEIQNQKLNLKLRLGIDSEKKTGNELTGLQITIKKLDKYINAHRNEFEWVCPHGTICLLRKRVKDFSLLPHPWFAGRWFFNYEILKDVKDGKLSKEDAWRYLCCASQGGDYKPSFDKKYCTDYIDYCLEHWSEITESLSKE